MGLVADHVRASLLIRGRVQGVFYRASTQSEARNLGLVGWVKNLPDESVAAVIEGRREDVDKLVSWCRQGPPAAKVSDVDAQWSGATGEFDSFDVR